MALSEHLDQRKHLSHHLRAEQRQATTEGLTFDALLEGVRTFTLVVLNEMITDRNRFRPTPKVLITQRHRVKNVLRIRMRFIQLQKQRQRFFVPPLLKKAIRLLNFLLAHLWIQTCSLLIGIGIGRQLYKSGIGVCKP